MAQKNSGKYGAKDNESDTDRSLFTRIVEGVIVFFICALMLKIGVDYILSIRVPLIIIAVIAATIVIGFRVWRWKRHHDDY